MSTKKEQDFLNHTNQTESSLNSTVHNKEEINYDDNVSYEIEAEEWIVEDEYNLENRRINRLLYVSDLVEITQQIHSQLISTTQYDPSLTPPTGISSGHDNANIILPTDNNTIRCIKKQPSTDSQLSNDILELFPGLNRNEIGSDLRKAQDKKEEIWTQIDRKYENWVITREDRSQMRRDVKRKFREYLWYGYRRQIEAMYKALSMIEHESNGIIFLNTKNQILAVQNHYGTWSGIKGHPKVKEDGTLEIPIETVVRELLEEMSVEMKRNKGNLKINERNITGSLPLKKDSYLECYVDAIPGTNDRSRCIGLFVVRIDEQKWKFSLKDTKENKTCQWLNIDDILNNKPEPGRDIYYTLRPFVQFIKNHPIS